jgi:hypothetical protein
MRSLDNWTTYDDTWGKPFQGKFTFYKLGTSELISITDVNGTRLSNPILSDMHGRTEQQVFLPDEDVTVVMHKWIGPGSMAEADTNDSHWTLVRSFDNLTQVETVIIDGQTVTAVRVSTKEDLQTLVVPQGVEYAILAGYYHVGDMPPVNYRLMTGTYQDNGGSVIQSCGNPQITNKYWVLIPDRVIDCRVFGVFPRNVYTRPTAYSSALADCFSYANKIGHDVYMPKVYERGTDYYWLEGGSYYLNQRLIIDNDVKICLKTETTSVMQVYEIKHDGGDYIFTSNGGSGHLTLNVTGTMRTSWFNPSWSSFPGTVKNVILDSHATAFTFKDMTVEVQLPQVGKTYTFEDCYIESNHMFKDCTLEFVRCGRVSDLWLSTGNIVRLVGNQIELSNMSSANAYIDWKNKQNENDYGDLGEQEISATINAGGTIENCYGSITIGVHGALELHNVSLTINGITASDSINAVDSWITLNNSSVISTLQIRRGSLSGSPLQVLSSLLLDDTDMNLPLTTLGAATEIRNSRIYGHVTATNITLASNQIYAEIDQRDVDGTVTVNCVGNMFNMGINPIVPARHYVHATNEGSVVNGIWANNGSSYDTIHWIRLDRTNLQVQDNAHHYAYMNNSEPYLQKYSGRNHPMHFPIYRANMDERDLYKTTALPFVCINDNTYVVYVVPRNISWKCFSVGRGYLARSATIRGTWDFGILESDYSEHTMGNITIIYTWGAQATSNSAVLSGQPIGYSNMVSRDGNGEANYEVSFEAANTDHNPDTAPGGNYSNGVTIGVLNRAPYDGWGGIARYPSTTTQSINLFVHLESNFVSGVTTPVGFSS